MQRTSSRTSRTDLWLRREQGSWDRRDLFETFERKFAALGSNLDDPPSKRRKSHGGGSSGASSNAAGPDARLEKKRKSSGDGGGSGEGGQRGGKSGAKKARSTPASKAASPHLASAPVADPHPAAVAPSAMEECASNNDTAEVKLERMQRRMAEMEAQILRITAAAAAAGVVAPSQVRMTYKTFGCVQIEIEMR